MKQELLEYHSGVAEAAERNGFNGKFHKRAVEWLENMIPADREEPDHEDLPDPSVEAHVMFPGPSFETSLPPKDDSGMVDP